MRWFDRKFDLGLPLAAFPPVLDRLCSMPDRLEAAVAGLRPDAARARPAARDPGSPALQGDSRSPALQGDSRSPALQGWSIQENIGHLLDLEELWEKRLDDFDAGAAVLHPTDLENRKTHEAGHNKRELADLLRDFRVARTRIAGRLEAMSTADLMRVGLHPRLQQPMSVIDLAFFVAEHDDHHLATIAALRAR